MKIFINRRQVIISDNEIKGSLIYKQLHPVDVLRYDMWKETGKDDEHIKNDSTMYVIKDGDNFYTGSKLINNS